jgi:hypothetical protein
MDNREELEEALELLRYTFEELKEIREDYYEPARIQDIIWKIGEFLGEF